MANPPTSPSPNPPLPDASGPVAIAGPAGALELHVDLPDDDVAPLPLVGIVCHPLPTEGGTMHNKVVTMAARAMRELGATTVRFNFRGRSEEHTSELQSLMRISYAVFCLKKKKTEIKRAHTD